MEAVPHQDTHCFALGMMVAVGVVLAGFFADMLILTPMRVAPDGEFLEGEEAEDAGQESRENLMRRQARLQYLGQQVQEGGCQQDADRKADGVVEPFLRQAEQHQRRGAEAQDAAQKAGKRDLGEQGEGKQGRQHGRILAMAGT